MAQRKHLWILPLLALAMIGAGCGKSTAEKSVENTIERSTNGQADVDIDGNTVRVNMNGSSWATGDQVSLPTDFPSDVYVADGTIKVAMSTPGSGWTVSLESTKSVSEVKALYERELVADGWTITYNMTVENSSGLSATKDNRSTGVTIGAAEGKTAVTITVLLKLDTDTLGQ